MDKNEFYTFLAMAMAITESGDSYPCMYKVDHGKRHGCIYHSFKFDTFCEDMDYRLYLGEFIRYYGIDFTDILKEIEVW